MNWSTFIHCQKATVDHALFLTLWREWKQCNQPLASEDGLYNKSSIIIVSFGVDFIFY